MKTDPLKSEGARLERAACRAYLRRKMKWSGTGTMRTEAFSEVLGWILTREKRYDQKKGGLGKK